MNKIFSKSKFENILKCVHCGLCLDYCPTYRELGDEKDSPRGRLYLMRGLWEGKLKLETSVIEPLNRCLDCRACETACPSGVPYGELLEKTRGIILENTNQSLKEKFFRKIFLKKAICSTNIMILISWLLKVYTAFKIPKIITETYFGKIFPKSFVFKHFLIPNFTGESFKRKYSKGISKFQSNEGGIKKNFAKVGLFSGCILDVSESEIHNSSIKILRYLGCEVFVPEDQSCCGALHVHSGDRKTSCDLALKNLSSFESLKLDAIITNAAGCGAQLKEYHLLFPDDNSGNQKEFSIFEKKIIDIMEYLSLYLEHLKNFKWKEDQETILYDSPCHLIHAQKVEKNPKKILNSLPGVNLVELEDSDWCCGSAGIYNLLQPELSGAILNRKTKSIINALKKYDDVTTIVTGNPGCLYQIRAGMKIRNIKLKILHPIVFLANRLIRG